MGVIPDRDDRKRAIDPERSFIVQAPAGSGKTELLTQRLLALLGAVSRPEEILAITFTRKAAGEMLQRLYSALEMGQGPPPETDHHRRTWDLARKALEKDRTLEWRLMDTPARLSIQTIDSFNTWLVRGMPWISRFGGVPEIAEEPKALYREAVRRTLDRAATGGQGCAAGARLLRHLDNRMERLEELLVDLLSRRDQWLRHLAGPVEESRGDKDLLERALEAYVCDLLIQGRALLPARLWPDIVRVGRHAGVNSEVLSGLGILAGLSEPPGVDVASLPIWRGLADLFLTKAGSLRRKVNKNCGFPPGEGAGGRKEAMEKLLQEPEIARWETVLGRIRNLPVPSYPDEQWQVLQALVELLKLSAAELWTVFGEKGQADFSEIAMRALDALGRAERPTELLLRLDARFNHILVDEFQDTSYLQYALLARLVEGWEPGDGRTLFLVGDPMQSIYRFREAEVGLFLRAQNSGIGNVALESLRLTTNFRSLPGIVEWVNETFGGCFPLEENVATGAVPYSAADPSRPECAGPAVAIYPRYGRDDQAEAGEVVGLVRGALAEGDSSVAVLVRSRAHLQKILPAFRDAGLPYLARDIDLLNERQVARDLVSLTRALLHAADRNSWLAVLRAPWCGLSLGDLNALCSESPNALVPDLLADPKALDRLSGPGKARAEKTFALLRRGMGQRGRIDLRRLVEGCWLALGGPACCDEVSLEDARRVLDLIGSLDVGGDLPAFDDLDRGLARLYSSPDVTADGRLQIMTIHRAKGLEFDTVILPGLGRLPARGDKPLLRWLEHPVHGLLLAPVAPTGEDADPLYRTIGELEREKDSHETTRLIYVASTRARRSLHLLGNAEPGADGQVRPAPGSLLEKLWPSVADAFVRPGPESRDPFGKEAKPERGWLHRLPTAWVPPPPEGSVVPRQVSLPAPSHLETRDDFPSPAYADLAPRQAGIVTHVLLERIGREGLSAWGPGRIAGLAKEIRLRLLREGIPEALEKGWTGKIIACLKGMVTGGRGRWILKTREEEGTEVAVSSPQMPMGIIDRTFVESGTRWIIDYKTSEPDQNETIDRFLARELERYSSQLRSYRDFFRLLEPHRNSRSALYFPMVDGWIELE